MKKTSTEPDPRISANGTEPSPERAATRSSYGQPCPRCGGVDRFYLIQHPRSQAEPFWKCRQCGYRENADPNATETKAAIERRELTKEEIAQVWSGYTAAARWSADYLWTPGGAAALDYLHERGLDDATLREIGIGYHPATWKDDMYAAIWNADPERAQGTRLGGLAYAQGRAASLLRDAITFPYQHSDTVHLLRTRKRAPEAGERAYHSPGGISHFAGGEPCFFLHNVLDEVDRVIVTEGEIKALLCYQAWRAGKLDTPAVATPGISALPAALLDALSNKTVYLAYDSEERHDPFTLSPGERYTIYHGERLTGLHVKRHIARLDARLAHARKQKDDQAADTIQQQIATLNVELERTMARGIRVKVIRLPRRAGVSKVDLDSFICDSGAAALQALIKAAPTFEDWHAKHGPGPYQFARDGIMHGARQLANYQAILVENISRYDGEEPPESIARFAVRTPSGDRFKVDIPGDVWADQRRNMAALRQAMCDGTADDEGQETRRAIIALSRYGGPPIRRSEYARMGWHQIDGRAHYLTPTGAITAAGYTSATASQIDTGALGNHYDLRPNRGDADRGAAAYMQFLLGEVCTSDLALLLAGHAALAPLHRFIGDSSRPLIWLVGESGGLKTALVRAGVLALYGSKFTTPGGDGAPLPKWDATPRGLEALMAAYQDAPMVIDDYKQATAERDLLARVLHAYSEGTGRSRMTASRKAEAAKPARCLAIVTGEDQPIGDTGQIARVLVWPIRRGDVRDRQLADLQAAGARGDLATFFAAFIAWIANQIDLFGEAGLTRKFGDLQRTTINSEDGHRRTAGAMHQEHVAFTVLCTWLRDAGHMSQADATTLIERHTQALIRLARDQAITHRDNRASIIFLRILREMLDIGEAFYLEAAPRCPYHDKDMKWIENGPEKSWRCTQPLGTHAHCDYTIAAPPPDRVIGFRHRLGIALHWEKAFTLVAKRRADQRQPIGYSDAAILRQFEADGLIISGTKAYHNAHKGKTERAIILAERAFEDAPDEPLLTPDAQNLTLLTPAGDQVLDSPTAIQRDKSTDLTILTDLTLNHDRDRQVSTDPNPKSTHLSDLSLTSVSSVRSVRNGCLPALGADNSSNAYADSTVSSPDATVRSNTESPEQPDTLASDDPVNAQPARTRKRVTP